MAADVRNGVTEERIDGGGGSRIVVRSRRPASATRAVVVICHGVNSHGGQYLWTLEQFAAAGFAAYVLDLRGRGKSDGARFYVESIADYVANVSALVKICKIARSGAAGVPARSQCRWRCVVHVRAGLPGRACRACSARASHSRCRRPISCSPSVKGLSHVVPASARAEAQERGLLARSRRP